MDFATIICKRYLGQAITVGGFIMGGAIPRPSKRGAYHDAHNATVDWHARKRLDANSAKAGLADGFWSSVNVLAHQVRDNAMGLPRHPY